MRIATAFTDKAKKEVHQSELKSFGVHFPCEVHNMGYAENNSRLWGLKGDPKGGWREDYLIFTISKNVKKSAEKPQKLKSKMANKASANNREITDVFPISCLETKKLLVKPSFQTHEDAITAAKKKSIDFKKSVIIEHFRGTNLVFTEVYENGERNAIFENKSADAPQGKEEIINPNTRVKKYTKVLPNAKKSCR